MKEMMQVRVTVENGLVVMTQPVPFMSDDAIIALNHEQVPLLIKWLREAVKEAAAAGS